MIKVIAGEALPTRASERARRADVDDSFDNAAVCRFRPGLCRWRRAASHFRAFSGGWNGRCRRRGDRFLADLVAAGRGRSLVSGGRVHFPVSRYAWAAPAGPPAAFPGVVAAAVEVAAPGAFREAAAASAAAALRETGDAIEETFPSSDAACTGGCSARFPQASCAASKRRSLASEAAHRGELRVVVEANLPLPDLCARSARRRAGNRAVFAVAGMGHRAQQRRAHLSATDRPARRNRRRSWHQRQCWSGVLGRRLPPAGELLSAPGISRAVCWALNTITGRCAEHFAAVGENPDELPNAPLVL
jgi:hypothetical protein